MSRANDPAYPVPGFPDLEKFNGMSLREHFAGLAMQAVLSRDDVDMEAPAAGAVVARHWADALILELSK